MRLLLSRSLSGLTYGLSMCVSVCLRSLSGLTYGLSVYMSVSLTYFCSKCSFENRKMHEGKKVVMVYTAYNEKNMKIGGGDTRIVQCIDGHGIQHRCGVVCRQDCRVSR